HCVQVEPNADHADEPCTAEGPLSGADSCDADSMCTNIDLDTGEGTCAPLCTGDTLEDCDDGKACTLVDTWFPPLCLPRCNPILQDCPIGQTCVVDVHEVDSFVCRLDESGAGGQMYDDCVLAIGPVTCDPGLQCWLGSTDVECGLSDCCLPF